MDELTSRAVADMAAGRGAISPTMTPVIVNQHLTKSMYAYQELRRMILEGELEPGSRLLLRDLAEQIGLSIQPIRDAIKMLERDGLVETQSHRGATVTEISRSKVFDLISVRLWLEVLAVQEAVPGHDEASLKAVEQTLGAAEETMKAEGDGLAYSQANRRLHEAIEAPAPAHVRELVADLWDQLWQARRQMSLFALAPTSARSAQREHKQLVAAVTRGDAQAAASAMAHHRDSTLTAWRSALEKLPAPSTE